MQNIGNLIAEPVASGLAGYFLSKIMIPQSNALFTLGGTTIEVAKGYGLVIAGSTLIADLLGDMVLPAALNNRTLNSLIAQSGKPLLVGGTTVGMYYLLNPAEVRANGLMAFTTGALSNVAGSYINNSFFKPMFRY